MVIEATCMDCGRTFRYNRIRKPKEPMKRCPKCARKHYASKYLAKHRVDMLVKALRKVQAYCAGQQHGCRECALYDHDQEVCRISGCGPAAWSIGSNPAWPDGCNLNLTRNHIIAALSGLRDLGEDTSSEYIPPEVENGLMNPAGKWFKVRFDRFKQAGQHVQIAGAEISLF